MDEKQKEEIALFRYTVIRPLVDEGPPGYKICAVLRDIANTSHRDHLGRWVKVSARTIKRWTRAWRKSGFEGLKPKDRCDVGSVRATEGEILDLAENLKREAPGRSSAAIAGIIAKTKGVEVSERTIRRHLGRRGATYHELKGQSRRVYGRFERQMPNDLWCGDVLHGPKIPDPRDLSKDRKTFLFCFIDDRSRIVPHGEFFFDESVPRLERALKVAIEKRGLPKSLYVDNGAVFVSHQLDLICARLGVRRIHSRPGEPAGRGKIERFFRTVRQRFLVEVEVEGVATLAELNSAFIAWLEVDYHHRVHSQTKQTPLERFTDSFTPYVPDPRTLYEAFLWEETRAVTKTATVSLAGNRYEVDPHLVGRKVSLRFDPFDLSRIEVFFRGASFGMAVPHILRSHTHKAAKGRTEEDRPKTGIDYLAALRDEHDKSLKSRIFYRELDEHMEENTDV